MNISAPFILRPVATTLLTIGIALAGALAYSKLRVAPLPQVDIPTITVNAQLPGASPDTVASTVAAPLERHLGQIANVTEMTSSSGIGQTRITLQFGLDRDIDGAARDVQAAINASRADLPTSLRSNPTYRKVNPADAPILILALTSKTLTRGQLYDSASNVLQQRLSQLDGVGQVIIGGAALPAVRVALNPHALFKYGIGLEDVRAALASANANSPKGAVEDGDRHYQIYTNDQASHAADYTPLVVAYRNGAAVRLSDVGDVQDSVEDVRNLGMANGKPSVLVILSAQPGANIIETVDRVKAELPHLKAAMPANVELNVAIDRSITIRASLHDTQITLLIAVALVTLVVFVFLGDIRATIIPSIAVPVSIIGTFAAMYLLNYSLDNLSLMALTIATGFVVDDAIVVLENISRHLDAGVPRVEAALRGAREVGFTVLSITASLVAVFLPILLMGGILGRFFREFTLTLSLAIIISLVISLTTTPMMCALFLRPRPPTAGPRRRTMFDRILGGYERTLGWALRHGGLVMLILFATVCLNVVLFAIVPYGLFPQQDTGRLIGTLRADQSVSFQAMSGKLVQMMSIVQNDPAVESVVGYTGAGSGGGMSQINTGSVFVSLKPLSARNVTADEVVARLRPQLGQVPGGRLTLVAIQDFRGAGGRQSDAAFQYTLQADNTDELYTWSQKLMDALQRSTILTDVSSDQQQKGLESDLVIDRDTASRLGVTPAQIDNTLYDAFGQRQVSVIYSALNQYHVVMEIDRRYTQRASMLRDIYVSTAGGNPSGTAKTNAAAGTVSVTARSKSSTRGGHEHAEQLGAQRGNQRAGQYRQRRHVSGRRRQHRPGINGSARCFHALPARQYAAVGEPSGSVRRIDHLVQSGAGRLAQRCPCRDPERRRRAAHAGLGAWLPCRHGAIVRAIAQQPAAAHRGGDRCGLYRARHSVRKLHPPDHDPLHAAVRRRRGGARAPHVPHGVQHHRDDRRDPADRHRQEECDHDDRLRARGQTLAQHEPARCHLSGLPAPLPSDHDDDHGGHARRRPARRQLRQRRGDPPPARDRDRGRAADQPIPHALHDAGRVSLFRPVRPVARRATLWPCRTRVGRAAAGPLIGGIAGPSRRLLSGGRRRPVAEATSERTRDRVLELAPRQRTLGFGTIGHRT